MNEGYRFIPFRPGMAWGPHMHRHPCPETDRLDAVLNGKAKLEPDPPRFRKVIIPRIRVRILYPENPPLSPQPPQPSTHHAESP